MDQTISQIRSHHSEHNDSKRDRSVEHRNQPCEKRFHMHIRGIDSLEVLQTLIKPEADS
jgi:hypothetical protein